MLWLIRKFWQFLSVIGGIAGAIWLGRDYEDRQEALSWWWERFPMLTTENLLIGVCIMAAIWILQLELRIALSDQSWPPVRHKLRHALGAVFKKDARIAELKLVADDSELRNLHISGAAFEIARRVNWQVPDFPVRSAEGHDDRYHLRWFEALCSYKQKRHMFMASMHQHAGERIAGLLEERAAQIAALQPAKWMHGDNMFRDDEERNEWNREFAQHTGLKIAVTETKGAIDNIAQQWRPSSNPDSDSSRQLLRDIEARILR